MTEVIECAFTAGSSETGKKFITENVRVRASICDGLEQALYAAGTPH
jgi:hypothetical protein